MAIQPGFRPIDNLIRQGPGIEPQFFQIGPNATAASMIPGVLVMRDTTDNYVKEYDGSGNAIGYLSYESSPDKPTDISTAYARGDWVAVERGPGKFIQAWLASGQNVVIGQPLAGIAATSAGQLAAGVAGTSDMFADAAMSVDASSAAKRIWVITRK